MAFFPKPPPPSSSSSPSSLVRLGILVLPPPFVLLFLLLFCLVSASSSLMASSSFATMPIDRDRSRNRLRELKTVVRPRFVVTSTATTPLPPESPPKGKVLDRWLSDRVKDAAGKTNEGKCLQESRVKNTVDKTKEMKCQQESQVRDIEDEKNEEKVCCESLVITKLGPDGDNSSGGSGKVGNLIQKWREIEAEAAVTPTNRSGHHQSVFSPTSESSDDTGWESDLTAESDKEQAQGIVGKQSEVGVVDQESLTRWRSGDKAFAGMFNGSHLRIRGREQIQNLIKKFEGERKREVEWLAERRAVSGFVHRKKIQNFLRYKSLQKHMAIQNLRPESTAQELDQLHHGIAILFLRQQFSPGPQQTCTPLPDVEKKTPFHMTFSNNKLDSMSFEMRQELRPEQERTHTYVPTVEKKTASYKQSCTDYFNSENYEFRQRFSPQRQEQACESLPTSDKKSIFHLSLSSNCLDSNIHQRKQPCSLAPLPSTEYHEEADEHDLYEIIQADEDSLVSGSEDLQEESQHRDLAWEEGNLQTRNIDWGRPSDASVLHSVEDGIVTEKSLMNNHQEMGESDGTWLSNAHASELQTGSGAAYCDLLETYSDNSELREILERRTVSTSLSSDFREKLNKVILSSLQRRRNAEENFIEEDQDEFVHIYDDGFHVDDRTAPSLSLLPLSSQTRANPHHERVTRDRHVIQMDVVLDMKTDIANIHTEMSELRKLLASYMERNAIPYSVQQDVTTVVRHSVSVGNSSFSSQREPIKKKGSCCICYEKQVDSLLYRCGHMCTCFKCATELQWSSERCPVCRSPIVDVVRAYTYP